MTLTYNDYEIDEATFPAHNVQWMLQSTLRRLMGNQVDAALSTWIKGQANGQDPEAFRAAHEAVVGRKRDELPPGHVGQDPPRNARRAAAGRCPREANAHRCPLTAAGRCAD
jgi:hypothetical protein